ncbi:MAG: hypothetical protein KDI06_10435 [Calditrichaeota bacterium]|nr:hypothetical protein [Calditrichota bacterium]HQU73490.1 hypothetical protein [Calditrichia bacterium]
MKMIGIMTIDEYVKQVRKLLKDHHIHIYSEFPLIGHSDRGGSGFGFWHAEGDLPIASTMCFAIVDQATADELFTAVEELAQEVDPNHPPRAFQMNVEKMI